MLGKKEEEKEAKKKNREKRRRKSNFHAHTEKKDYYRYLLHRQSC